MPKAWWKEFLVLALAVQMSGRILTPNGDGVHDTVLFNLAGSGSAPQSEVYDARGRRIAQLESLSPTQLAWNGKDLAGRPVSSGVYLIQISQDSALWSGIVTVAR